jgi:hypothetical protein
VAEVAKDTFDVKINIDLSLSQLKKLQEQIIIFNNSFDKTEQNEYLPFNKNEVDI